MRYDNLAEELRRLAGDRRRAESLRLEIKAFVVVEYTRTYAIQTDETNPLKAPRPSDPAILSLSLSLSLSVSRARPGTVGEVLFENKNLTNMPRFAEEWRRSAPSSRSPPRFLPGSGAP